LNDIYDGEHDFKEDSIYIKQHIEETLMSIEAGNFLELVKLLLKRAFKQTLALYEANDEYELNRLLIDWRFIHNKATEYEKAKMNAIAVKQYDKALKIYENEKSFMGKGAVLGKLGKGEEAIEAYLKSLAINPNYQPSYNNLAFEYYKIEDYPKALEYINRAIEINDDDAMSHATKAEVLFGMEKEDEFFVAFEAALERGINPNILDSSIHEKYRYVERYKVLIEKYEE
jgi:tetratricopeptide (TPR) repeat protein